MIDTLAWIVVGASLVPAHRSAWQVSRSLLVSLVTVEAVALALLVLAGASTDAWMAVAQEDGVVEWATVVAFVMAAGWLVLVVRKESPSWWFKGACFLLATFCIVIAGEEISWGQRLLRFKPPDVFLERNFQQELNLHNVLMHEGGLGFKLESKHLVMAIVLGFGLAWPWLVRRARFKVFAPLAPPFALAPLALGVLAIQIDYPVALTGEGAELIVGLIFLASALAATRLSARAVAGWLLAPVLVGWLVSTVLARVVFGSDEEGTRTAAAELAVLQADVVKGVTEELARKNVHKRVYTAVLDGYLELSGGAFLQGQGTPARPAGLAERKDRLGYFLDPWNNPYWVHFDKGTRTGSLYSFGPNRRRDVAIRKGTSAPGDDIIVRFTLGAALPAITGSPPAGD
ncbi:MAG: hypothetical protein H0X17_02305 [Deltaproteobacteria bacterium]|nr:hypothetical protein [Deltaproteobacteria bacterium]